VKSVYGVELVRVPYDHWEVPFDADDPLVFHVLTTVPSGDRGERRFEQLVLEDAAIAPPDEAARVWGETSAQALMMPRDIEAGDDQWAFFTPLRPFHHSVASTQGSFARHPAVAYHQSTLERITRPAFRVYDLEWAYARMTSMVDPYNDVPYTDEYEDDDEPPPPNEEALQASAVSEELRAIAECGTQYDPRKASRILHLYALAASKRIPGREALASAHAEDLLPRCDAHEWTAVPEDVSGAIERAWGMLFTRHDHYSAAEAVFHREPPEVLVGCCVPLRDADFVRDGRGVWHPVDKQAWR